MLVVIFILLILAAWGVSSYIELRAVKKVEQATQSIVATLELAKSDALAGRGNLPQGVKFNTDSYELFSGTSYDTRDDEQVYTLDSDLELSTNLSGDEEIVFARLTGFANEAATISVSLVADDTVSQSITVSEGGAINVLP